MIWAGNAHTVAGHLPELDVFTDRTVPVVRPDSARSALQRIMHDSVSLGAIALAAHGDAEPGLAHGVQLSDDTWLRAFHLLGADLPPNLFIGACHSGFAAGADAIEPIGLPTVAMCAGARCVIAASTRIPDSIVVSQLLASVYGRIVDGVHPARALRAAQLEHRHEHDRTGPIVVWAPITSIGTAPHRPADASVD